MPSSDDLHTGFIKKGHVYTQRRVTRRRHRYSAAGEHGSRAPLHTWQSLPNVNHLLRYSIARYAGVSRPWTCSYDGMSVGRLGREQCASDISAAACILSLVGSAEKNALKHFTPIA